MAGVEALRQLHGGGGSSRGLLSARPYAEHRLQGANCCSSREDQAETQPEGGSTSRIVCRKIGNARRRFEGKPTCHRTIALRVKEMHQTVRRKNDEDHWNHPHAGSLKDGPAFPALPYGAV